MMTSLSSRLAPVGHGVFIRNWVDVERNYRGDTMPIHMRWLRAVGFRWVAIQACWQDADYEERTRASNLYDARHLVRAATAAGIRPWLWGYPRPSIRSLGRPREEVDFVETMAARMSEANVDGVILDPEKPWKKGVAGFDASKRMTRLIDDVLDLLSEDQGLGMTSYSLPHLHSDMPWKAMARGFGMPQIYSISDRSARQSVDRYRSLGFQTVVPLWSGASKNRPARAGAIDGRLDLLEEIGDGAVGCWSSRLLKDHHLKAMEGRCDYGAK